MRSLIKVVGFMACAHVNGQYWSDAGIVIDHVGSPVFLYVDTANNKLYSTGIWVHDWAQPNQSFRYIMLDDGQWSLSDPISNLPYTICNYQDTLFLGGDFTYVDSTLLPYAACMVDGVWQSCGSFNQPVRKFKVIDDELYVTGLFTMIDGQPCKGVAKRVGNGWQCVGDLGCEFCGAYDIIHYQDRLVVSGTLTFGPEPYHHVMQYVNGSWIPVGPYGILGGLSGGGPLAVYQGDMYIGGLIHLSAGNAGFALMRWDGSNWSQVGEGLQDETGGTVQHIQVKGLMVHDGKLFVAGGFTYAGNVLAERIATWDGVQWCSVGGDFDDYDISALAFYNDTLYIGCGLDAVVDGQPIKGVAKFIAPEFENNCSDPQTVPIAAAPAVRLLCAGSGRYRLLGNKGINNLSVFGPLGQLCQSRQVVDEEEFDLPRLATGVYVARSGQWSQRLVVE